MILHRLRPSWRNLRWLLLPLLTALAGAQTEDLVIDPPAFAILAGEIRDRDTGQPVVGARLAVGEAASTQTDGRGRYTLAGLAGGSVAVIIQAEGFLPLVITDVELNAGQVRELSVNLIADLITLDEFVISATRPESEANSMLIIRSQAIEFSDALGRNMLDRAAVSTAAAALRLVVGATVAEGKYAVVRGLSDRYTSTVLNGLPVPSADPTKRAVQIDLFPARMIGELNVSKTFTPDQPADATGGRVNIITRSLPEETFLEASLGISYAPGTTGNDRFPTYTGGGVRTLPRGSDVGSRALPVAALEGLPNGPYSRPFSTLAQAQAYDRATRAFSPVMGTRREAPGPGQSQSLAAGHVFRVGEASRLGVMGGFSRRLEYDFREQAIRRRYTLGVAGGVPDLRQDMVEDVGTESVLWNALGVVGLSVGSDHDLSLLAFYNMAAEDTALYGTQTNPNLGLQQNQALVYQQRQLAGLRLRGEHRTARALLPAVDWTLGTSRAGQFQPDTRFFRNSYNPANNQAFLSGQFDADRLQRIFRDVDDRADVAALNLRWDLPFFGGRTGDLKLGGMLDDTDRSYRQRIFTYRLGTPGLPIQTGTVDPLWTDTFLADDRIGLADPANRQSMRWALYELVGRNAPDYAGRQKIEALYFNIELPVLPSLWLTGGARLERTLLRSEMNSSDGTINRVVQTDGGSYFVFFGAPQETGNLQLQQTDLLPAFSARWQIRPKLQLRASVSQTLAKPTFLEVVPVITRNDGADIGFIGNPELKLVESRNADLRLEWFPAREEVIAVSVFTKRLRDPIERINLSQSSDEFIAVINYPKGEVTGVELEYRRNLSTLPWLGSVNWLRQLTLGANYTWLDSKVEVPLGQQIGGLMGDSRRLFNQPAYLANLNLSWDHPSGWSAGLFYVATGDILVAGAAATETGIAPSLIDEASSSLDFNVKLATRRWALALSAKNLLDPEVQRRYDIPSPGSWLFSSYRRGRSISLSLGLNF